jgi:hypothetical protein
LNNLRKLKATAETPREDEADAEGRREMKRSNDEFGKRLCQGKYFRGLFCGFIHHSSFCIHHFLRPDFPVIVAVNYWGALGLAGEGAN